MATGLEIASISAPGFYGLNTQDSPLDLSSGFALIATNCVIDKYGRVGSRKGWTPLNSSTGNLGSNDVTVMHELVQADGTLTVLFAGNNKLFKLGTSNAVTELTYGGGGTAPTITANNWQCASLNGITYFFQSGHDPLIFDPAVSTTTYRRVSEKTGYVATVPNANICISAYGRLWAANTTSNNATLYYSDLIAGHVWATGSSGSLNVNNVWPSGADEVTGLAAHNGFLFIFGKRQILVYKDATSPSTMSLSDTVESIGCIARDSIQTTSSDVVFLSNGGVRSLMRTIQEKSAPERDLSKNVRDDLTQKVNSETLANIKSVHSEKEAFYLLSLPVNQQVYCFDTKVPLQDGSYRATTWDSILPKSFLSKRNGDVLIGKTGYVAQYAGYKDDTSPYRMAYYTNHSDLGNQSRTSIIKKISVVIIGGSNQYVTIKWGYDFLTNYLSENVLIPAQGVSEYGIAEYGANATVVAYYSEGVALQTLVSNGGGSGKIVQTGYEMDINGSQLSIQKIEIQSKQGRLT
jgi:hypothetical protein